MSRAELLAAALTLEPSERIALSVELLESVDAVDDVQADVQAAWEIEAERRVEELERGEAETVSAEEVFARFGLVF